MDAARLVREWRGASSEPRSSGRLTPSDFAVYSALRLMQPTTPTDLAGTLGMRVTTLSSVLARMESQAHLRRQPIRPTGDRG
jgi:DNA-binding MarR family transcriptional regulator